MENLAYLDIILDGKKDDQELKPGLFDIADLKELIDNVENILYPYSTKKERPIISYEVLEGSVKNRFRTVLQTIIGVNAILLSVKDHQTIDFLEKPVAQSIQNIQNWSKKNNLEITIKTSITESAVIEITPKTNFYVKENIWVPSELVLYGKVTNLGGTKDPNIHLLTKEYGMVIIRTPMQTLADQEINRLYKYIGVSVVAKQNIYTAMLDKKEVKFKKFEDYTPKNNLASLNKFIDKAKNSWSDVDDVDKWLSDLRGEN